MNLEEAIFHAQRACPIVRYRILHPVMPGDIDGTCTETRGINGNVHDLHTRIVADNVLALIGRADLIHRARSIHMSRPKIKLHELIYTVVEEGK